MNVLKEITLYDLHKKWGHVSYDYLKKLIAQNPEIINYKIKDFTEVKCVECGEANIKRNPIPHQCTYPLAETFDDHLHMDIWGPAPVEAYGKIRYLLTIVDNTTRWVEMFEMKHNNDAFTK
jgi:hypothetical protein